jgi:hypothetical protein
MIKMIRIVVVSAVIVIAIVSAIITSSSTASQGIFSHTAPGNSQYNPYLHPMIRMKG